MLFACRALFVSVLVFFVYLGQVSASDIILAPGDRLQVFVPGLELAEQNYEIDIQGEIDLDIYGKVKLSNLKISDAEEKLRNHLSKYLKSVSGISILLRQRGRIVLITGCVQNPGVLTIEPADDLWQALHRAGGLSGCADVSKIVFLRNGKELDYDLKSYLTRDTEQPLPPLKTGDTIFVPSGPGLSSATDIAEPFLGHEALRRRVFVLGSVESPGMYNRASTMDVLTIVSAAGGPSENADLANVILLTKDESLRVNLNNELTGKTKKRKLLPEDSGAIIYVPFLQENIDTRLGNYINVIGPFERTGRISVSGPIKLIDAIGLVGGPGEDAKLRHLRVIEEGHGYTLATRYNLKNYLREGGAIGRIMVKPGSTIVIGRRDLEPLNIIFSSLGAVGMISSAVALWLTATGTLAQSR